MYINNECIDIMWNIFSPPFNVRQIGWVVELSVSRLLIFSIFFCIYSI